VCASCYLYRIRSGYYRLHHLSFPLHSSLDQDFVSDSLSVLSDSIVNKYALFILQFSPNIHAKEFLKEVIIRQLSKFLLLKVETTVKEESVKCEKCSMDLSKQITVKHRIDEIVEENGMVIYFLN
jgi:hypothetical protein